MRTSFVQRTGLLVAFVLAAGCSHTASTGTSNDQAVTESASDYDFQLPGPGDQLERIDAMGVALLSTVLMNRDRTPSGADNHSQYQKDTPDVQNNPTTLVSFITFLHRLHAVWRDNLAETGFEPCSQADLTGLVVLATPCTLQKLRFDEDPSEEGPRVIDAVLPDYISLDFDQPLRFPNGRTPWEPISDKIFALGFLKMGGDCSGLDKLRSPGLSVTTGGPVPRDDQGRPICTIESFANLPLQVAENDRPYSDQDKATFPYLARPWFYPPPASDAPYYWPTAARMGDPE
jgi:hypothetical protein